MLWRCLALIHSSRRYTYILNSVFSIQSTKVVTVFNVDGRFGHENVSCSREYIFLISLCSLVFLGEIFFRSSHWSSSVPPLLLVFDNFTSHKHTTRKTKKNTHNNLPNWSLEIQVSQMMCARALESERYITVKKIQSIKIPANCILMANKALLSHARKIPYSTTAVV